MKEMYQLTATQVMNHFDSPIEGLTSTQAEERRRTSGWNELTAAKSKPLWKLFLEQFQDFLVIILIIAAIISGLLGDAESAVVILVVITLNAILGTVQTRQAERSLNSLKNLSAPKASVFRDGSVVQLPARDLIPGDIVLLEAGDIVPADGRIMECAGLKIDESALTKSPMQFPARQRLVIAETWCFPVVSLPMGVEKLLLLISACIQKSAKSQIFYTIPLRNELRCKYHLILSAKNFPWLF